MNEIEYPDDPSPLQIPLRRLSEVKALKLRVLPRGERLLLERALADPKVFEQMMATMLKAKSRRRRAKA